MTSGTLLELMTWSELKEMASDHLLILPVGATEQHGPHLPLSTDAIIVGSFAKAIASKVCAVVAPTICYGYYSRPRSGGGESFPGTTSVDASTLIKTVKHLSSAFIRHGFRKLLILNGHYENRAILPEGLERAIQESRIQGTKSMVMDWSDGLTEEILNQAYGSNYPGLETDHASLTETSLLLYLRPELVRTDRIPDDKTRRIVKYEIMPAPPETFTPSGSLWSAFGASKEKGEALFLGVTENLVRWVRLELGVEAK